jgi:hypothetical protein
MSEWKLYIISDRVCNHIPGPRNSARPQARAAPLMGWGFMLGWKFYDIQYIYQE